MYLVVAGVFTLGLVTVTSCGKKSKEQKDQEAEGGSSLQSISATAMAGVDIDQEAPAYKGRVEAAGYQVKEYVRFPAEELGVKGRLLLYTDKGNKRGGVVYFKKTGNLPEAKPAWHWYFSDLAPQAASNVELNEDGLWDLEIDTKGGEKLELIQDEMFTLMGPERPGWIAMNGRCSPPVDVDDMMWKCFDGDTATAWRSSTDSSDGAYLEFDAPFGLEEGVLSIRTMDSEQPSKCKVSADGKDVQTFDLEPKAAEQVIQVGPALAAAKTIRLTFEPATGGGNVVAVAELEVK